MDVLKIKSIANKLQKLKMADKHNFTCAEIFMEIEFLELNDKELENALKIALKVLDIYEYNFDRYITPREMGLYLADYLEDNYDEEEDIFEIDYDDFMAFCRSVNI